MFEITNTKKKNVVYIRYLTHLKCLIVTTLRCLYQNVYTTGGISGAGMSNPSGTSEFTLSFEWNSVT